VRNWFASTLFHHPQLIIHTSSSNRLRGIVGGDYPQIAIGTVCKCRNVKWITYCCKYARKIFPRSWIHAFGLTLKALPHVKRFIDSWDSTAWTFPRTPGRWSSKNRFEDEQYFKEYLSMVSQILSASNP